MKGEAQRQHPASDRSVQAEPITLRTPETTMTRRNDPSAEPQTRNDKKVNEDSADSFPASDPPSFSPTTAGSTCDDDDDSCSKDDE